MPGIFKGSKFTKVLYVDLLAMLFEILAKVRKEGLMSIENDVENPKDSPIFGKYPSLSSDHHVMEFITDYLRMMVGGNLNAIEIENLMDIEIETHHHEVETPGHVMSKVADAVPAFGIVVAVMGVVRHGFRRRTAGGAWQDDPRSVGRHFSGYPDSLWLRFSGGQSP